MVMLQFVCIVLFLVYVASQTEVQDSLIPVPSAVVLTCSSCGQDRPMEQNNRTAPVQRV